MDLALGMLVQAHVPSLGEVECFIGHSGFGKDPDLALLFQEGSHPALLLAEEWHRLQLILPFLSQGNGVFSYALVVLGIPLAVGVLNDSCYILRVQCIPALVHVIPTALSTLWVLIRE